VKQKGKILIVDDNEGILLSLEIFLEKYFEKVVTLNSPERIKQKLSEEGFDVFLLDMNFSATMHSGNEGMFWMQEILKLDPQASIIFITAYPGLELAVKAIKKGAFDFIEKPWNKDKLLTTVMNAVKLRESKDEVRKLKDKQSANQELIQKSKIIKGKSPQIKKVMEAIGKVAVTDASVLILGENGTGKEITAKEIHNLSQRKNECFIKVDVGSLPESLFESELFGYVKGAFTDARQDKAGKIELAHGGTLFLDEIGNLSLSQQSKLLSVLQEKKVNRIGSNQSLAIDFRLICATNQSLNDMLSVGEFREDLLYRLNTVQIELPPLRERITDVMIFSDYFLENYKTKYAKPDLFFGEELIRFLKQFDWPGNIRQLDHAIENAVIMSDENQLSINSFVLNSTANFQARSADKLNFYENEKELVSSALKESNGNLSKAANILGVARTTLYRKMKKYGF
jgi:DNA-binding NtrC family response regulator